MSGRVENETPQHSEVYLNNLKAAALILEKNDLIGLIEPINNYSVPRYFLNNYAKGNVSKKTILF